jgi:hypothetical protein
MKKTLLVAFGDSWTFGSELDIPREDPWVKHLADRLGVEYVNMGVPASSIGHTAVQLFDFIKQYPNFETYKLIFMVGLTAPSRYLSYNNKDKEFINITSEAPYSTSNIHFSGRPPACVMHMQDYAQLTYRHVEDGVYNEFLGVQTVFQFQQFCFYNKIDCLFFSYFDKLVTDNYGYMIRKDLIYPTTITCALTGEEYDLPGIRENQYFAGKLFHPNALGHQRIAELLHEQYLQTYC